MAESASVTTTNGLLQLESAHDRLWKPSYRKHPYRPMDTRHRPFRRPMNACKTTDQWQHDLFDEGPSTSSQSKHEPQPQHQQHQPKQQRKPYIVDLRRRSSSSSTINRTQTNARWMRECTTMLSLSSVHFDVTRQDVTLALDTFLSTTITSGSGNGGGGEVVKVVMDYDKAGRSKGTGVAWVRGYSVEEVGVEREVEVRGGQRMTVRVVEKDERAGVALNRVSL